MILSVIGLAGLSILLGTHYPSNMQGTYWLILVFGCLSGCGVATFSVGAGQSSYWFPKNKQGFALGIFGDWVPWGQVCSPSFCLCYCTPWGLCLPITSGLPL